MIGEADSPSIATPSTQATMTRASRQTAAAAPGETGRSVVSVLLVIYLVGLALSVAGNSASGTSALVRAVKGRLFAVWMVPAWLDLGFDTRLTYGLPEDGDHAIELRPHGRRAAEPILLPPPGGGERAARWRRLARGIAEAVDEDAAAGLAAAVARSHFAALDATDVDLRILRWPLPEYPDTTEAGPPERIYSVRVRLVDGDLQLIKAEARGEVAPLLRRPAAPAGDRP